ncbi:Hypothetical predicted protein [Pelobates cultripes]|uniref:Uncharacterized protein n=1 Tax=Pelobates cultripes TaxID=61616 RepID=A0AAD1S1G5_PELCU|nr:Hypothetical predicted protein [Pelobates cultripes]
MGSTRLRGLQPTLEGAEWTAAPLSPHHTATRYKDGGSPVLFPPLWAEGVIPVPIGTKSSRLKRRLKGAEYPGPTSKDCGGSDHLTKHTGKLETSR